MSKNIVEILGLYEKNSYIYSINYKLYDIRSPKSTNRRRIR